MYPIKSNKMRVSSAFGVKRKYKVNGKTFTDIHKGIDLVADPKDNNAKIINIAEGVVSAVRVYGKNGDNTGCFVRVKHDNGLYSLYYHMKSGSIKVKKGDQVKKGDVLGTIGMTGLATGVHLHFQIDKGSSSSAINPTDYALGKKEIIERKVLQKLLLPSSAHTWRVYKLDVSPVKGNECGFLRPHKFGGLTYDILKWTSKNVCVIKTRDFGEVQIYVAPSTGAVIK